MYYGTELNVIAKKGFTFSSQIYLRKGAANITRSNMSWVQYSVSSNEADEESFPEMIHEVIELAVQEILSEAGAVCLLVACEITLPEVFKSNPDYYTFETVIKKEVSMKQLSTSPQDVADYIVSIYSSIKEKFQVSDDYVNEGYPLKIYVTVA